MTRNYHERLALRGFFFHKKDGYYEIYFKGKYIRVYDNGVFGYVRINTLLCAKRNVYHVCHENRRNLKKEHVPNTTFTSFENRKRREEK